MKTRKFDAADVLWIHYFIDSYKANIHSAERWFGVHQKMMLRRLFDARVDARAIEEYGFSDSFLYFQDFFEVMERLGVDLVELNQFDAECHNVD